MGSCVGQNRKQEEQDDNQQIIEQVLLNEKHERIVEVVNTHRQCKVQRKLIKLNRDVENGFELQFIPKQINKKYQ